MVMLLATTPLGVVAVEADLPGIRLPRQRSPVDDRAVAVATAGRVVLAVLIEGSDAGVASRAHTAVTLLGGDAVARTRPPSWWGRYPFGEADTALRLTVPDDAVHAAVYSLRDAVGPAVALRGSIARGLLYAGLPATLATEVVSGAVDAVRHTLMARGGTCAVLRAPAAVRATTDHSMLLPGEGEARDLKERFDPAGRFAPGRLPHVA
jgi:glycolate oxidase FAD binding subunit